MRISLKLMLAGLLFIGSLIVPWRSASAACAAKECTVRLDGQCWCCSLKNSITCTYWNDTAHCSINNTGCLKGPGMLLE